MKPRNTPESEAPTSQQPKPMQEINLKLTVDETNLVLEGLGSLPFAKVYALIARIQEQAGQQLDQAAPKESRAIPEGPKERTKADA